MNFDPVNKPKGYNTPVPVKSRQALKQLGFTDDEMNEDQCILAIAKVLTPQVVFWFCVCNAVKYLWRLGSKGHPVEDVQKAKWYLNHALSLDVVVSEDVRARVEMMRNLLPEV